MKKGFSLLELMIVIAIVLALSAVSIPYMGHFLYMQRLQGVAFQITQDFSVVKENAIAYQQDLNFYINYSDSLPSPHGNSTNRRVYYFEKFVKDSTSVPNKHYIPSDNTDSHFTRRDFSYHIYISNISVNNFVTLSGSKYFVLAFRSGANNTFRGEADIVNGINSDGTVSGYTTIGDKPVVIELSDSKGNHYYVRVSATGKISMYGQPKPY